MQNNYAKLAILCLLISVAAITAFAANIFLNRGRSIGRPYNSIPFVTEYKPVETKLFFAGDIMLSRNVMAAMYKAEDFTLPFANVKARILSSNLIFANLESPFNQTGDHSIEGSLIFNADPKAIAGLTSSGFDILSTANNHSFDQGQNGIAYTMQILKDNGIIPIGTGPGCHDGTIVEKNGIKFGYLAYSYTAMNDGGKSVSPLVCDWNNTAQVNKDVAALKLKVDFVILSSHMGTEYTRTPKAVDVEKVHAALDAGADMFVGHHPHWIQITEQYKGKFIFYSLGNFVFDQMWSQDTREGLTFEVLFQDKKLSRIKLLPVIIDNFCCPRWANEEETKTILKKINLTSDELIPIN